MLSFARLISITPVNITSFSVLFSKAKVDKKLLKSAMILG